MPTSPLQPKLIVDSAKFTKDLEEYDIKNRIHNTYKNLQLRLGDDYYQKFYSFQSKAIEIGIEVFPAYQMIFLDVTCEDWLSLLDFHKNFSRDHSVHQPLTAYIVCKLLGGGDPDKSFKIGGKSILEMATDALIDSSNVNYFYQRCKYFNFDYQQVFQDKKYLMSLSYQIAIITAMYHDIGYPWQFIERLHDSLDDRNKQSGYILCGERNINDYIKEHKNDLMFQPFYEYGNASEQDDEDIKKIFEDALYKTHGLPGALVFYSYNNYYNSSNKIGNSELIKFCQEWISLGIMMHDMVDIYEKHNTFPRLDFKVDPLSFIISLADTLEDFNRPNANIIPNTKGCKIDYSFPTLSVDLEETDGNGIITYTVDAKSKSQQDIFKLKDQKRLFDINDGFFNLQSIGLTSMTIKNK